MLIQQLQSDDPFPASLEVESAFRPLLSIVKGPRILEQPVSFEFLLQLLDLLLLSLYGSTDFPGSAYLFNPAVFPLTHAMPYSFKQKRKRAFFTAIL